MHRFYCPNLAPITRLDGPQTHHAKRVLRMEQGDQIELFDGRGMVAKGTITGWEGGLTVQCGEMVKVPISRPVVDVAVAIPKGPRADEMVNQLSQGGVDRLIPLAAERSVFRPGEGKLEKFKRLAVESAKQAGRAWLMEVVAPAALDQLLALPHDLRLLASPDGAVEDGLVLQRIRNAQRILILIGPEGGWSPPEVELAEGAGCLAWCIGPHVLRIETAAVMAAGLVRYLAK